MLIGCVEVALDEDENEGLVPFISLVCWTVDAAGRMKSEDVSRQ
jgi:hypothetical protein